jgi:intracellular sulfur oxidation DsrE/DsrF family protein
MGSFSHSIFQPDIKKGKSMILNKLRITLFATTLLFSLGAGASQSLLEGYSYDHLKLVHALPFAKHHAVMQVSQDDPELWNLTLNNAANMLEYFGADKIQVVVVAYGPGLKMLVKNSPVAKRLQALDAEGVEFDACNNTLQAMTKKLGHTPELAPEAVLVPGGIVRIMQLEQHGYNYIKP